MTKSEFKKAMAVVTAGCGKSLSQEGLAVYFDTLKEVPCEVMAQAVLNVLRSHVWATFPSVAELWQAAVKVAMPKQLTSGEAWRLAKEAAWKIEPETMDKPWVIVQGGKRIEFESHFAAMTEGLPEEVVEAMRQFGIEELAYAEAKFARSQFMRIFEQVQARDCERLILPAAPAKDSFLAISDTKGSAQ
jgi:hypothetical protein